MALTRITKGVIKPNENYDTHNINSTGIITAVGGDFSGNVSVGGVLTYEDVTSIDSVGIITAQKDIHVGAGISVVGVSTFSEDIIVNGLSVGKGASSGAQNTVLGAGAFDRTGIGAQNTAIGNNALTNNNNGSGGTAVGHDAAFSNTTGNSNTAVGRDALRQNNSSDGNTAIGRAALYYNSAENNTALGQNSLFNVGAGKSNTAVGQSAGNNIVQGSNNLVLGYNAQATANNVSNEITLGNSLMNHLRVPGIGVSFSESGAFISGVVTATSFVGDGAVTINNNGTSKLITGSGSANTLNANVHLTFDGTTLDVKSGNGTVNAGIVTATSFFGDGSNLTGVSGFATALSNDQSSSLNVFFKTPKQVNVSTGESIVVQSDATSGNIAFCRESIIHVSTGATMRVATGTQLRMNVLDLF